MTSGSPRVGSNAQKVSDGEIDAIIGTIMMVRTVVSTRYITAGPATMRSARRSLVARAISSPTGKRWKNGAERSIRCPKRSLRRSVSTLREAPLSR